MLERICTMSLPIPKTRWIPRLRKTRSKPPPPTGRTNRETEQGYTCRLEIDSLIRNLVCIGLGCNKYKNQSRNCFSNANYHYNSARLPQSPVPQLHPEPHYFSVPSCTSNRSRSRTNYFHHTIDRGKIYQDSVARVVEKPVCA